MSGKYVPVKLSNTVPGIDRKQAVSAAIRALTKASPGKPGLEADDPRLVIWGVVGTPKLAYEVNVSAVGGRWRVWVDAIDGSVLLAYDNLHRIAPPTSNGANATITGSTLASEGGASVSLTGWRESNGIHYLSNKDRRWLIYNVATFGYSDNNTFAYRNTSSWGSSDRVEMSAARNFDLTQRYFAERHGLNSYDRAGAYARANVHFGTSYVNAYWDGQSFYFGDGDGRYANSLVVVDVAAHEYTHAITEYSADLYYYGESGALNESFSDIFSACVEFYAQPDGRSDYPNVRAGYSDWLLGEDCWLASKSLRDMRNPRNAATVGSGVQPSRYRGTHWYFGSEDNGGVHYNSGVQNFFFYLLCEGGSGNNDGISYSLSGLGLANAERIAYRTLTVYCSQYTDYAGARAAWISAAQDLNPSWVSAVEAAWAACGVGAGSSSGDGWDPGDNNGLGATALTLSTSVQSHGPHSLSGSDQYDWFKFYLQSGQSYVFHTQGSSGDNYGELYSDSSGATRVAYNDDGGGDNQFYITYVPIATGWFYLRVRAYSVGANLQYTLKYQQLSGSSPGGGLGDALDLPSLNWRLGGNDNWTAQSTVTYDGIDAAQSGTIGHSQATWFETTLTGPGTLSFWWRVSSESGYDFQRFQLNGNDMFVRSGEAGWEYKSVVIPAGEQVVRWAYTKDGSVVRGSDRAWVDQVYWSAGQVLLGSAVNDYDGDGASDIAVFTSSYGEWDFGFSSHSHYWSDWTQYGWSAVRPVPADYDGDGLADLAVYHPASGKWYIQSSGGAPLRVEQFGWSASIPLPGDYNGDGLADLAVFHKPAARWYFRLSGGGGDFSASYGWSAVIPVPADYNGDGVIDVAVYHPATGNWYPSTTPVTKLGGGKSLPVPADYDGDGRADLAVFTRANGNWSILFSGGGSISRNFGWSAVLPVPADYDGDGRADLAVYHPSGARFYILLSETGETIVRDVGLGNSNPVLLNSLIHFWFKM